MDYSLLAVMLGRLRFSLLGCLDVFTEIGEKLLDQYPFHRIALLYGQEPQYRNALKSVIQNVILKRTSNDNTLEYFHEPQTSCRT